MTKTATDVARARIAEALRTRQRFVITSHTRPDGDAIGSQLAMAYALRHLGKDVRLVNRDAPPEPMRGFPGVAQIEIAERLDDPGDAVIVMECPDLQRTGLEGLDRGYVINIDHHHGNARYGALNWLDLTAAACGEMVFALVGDLGVPLTLEIATHVYVAILTDTGEFRHSNITPVTFDICRRCVEAGVSAPEVAQRIFHNSTLGRVKLFGAALNRMELDPEGRVALLAVDRRLAEECGGTYDDTEGLINFPLTVKDIQAVVFFKEHGDDTWRVSMRSKGDVDVFAVAAEFGGGGHKNASGCTANGRIDDLKALFSRRLQWAIESVAVGARS